MNCLAICRPAEGATDTSSLTRLEASYVDLQQRTASEVNALTRQRDQVWWADCVLSALPLPLNVLLASNVRLDTQLQGRIVNSTH